MKDEKQKKRKTRTRPVPKAVKKRTGKKTATDRRSALPHKSHKKTERLGSSKQYTKRKTAQSSGGKTGRKRPTGVKRGRRLVGELLLSLFLAMGLIYIVSLFTFTFYSVDSYMMAPAVNAGDTVFVNKLKAIRRFDLVLFRSPTDGELSVRRVIGVPGDRLYYQADVLYLNEQEQVERFLNTALKEARQNDQQFTEDFRLSQVIGQDAVPKDSYFVLGDNRTFAADSRSYGVIHKKEIIGVVRMKVLPLHEMTYL
ncbi:signal peptidase I [Enterococcus sp. BWR-S5]|uniref:signal peptidase I n=1 Tax=Enterococcus sp. BWR-S5 TaxID=2787714 RepID=UPI0019241DDD|nr:signal peptidase I [Enterococcus sp. BWR-S5]MBL1225164.1 signal peptidase I [Enterococcus sp. BWR-S5]